MRTVNNFEKIIKTNLKVYIKVAFYFGATFIGLYGVVEVLEYFDINILKIKHEKLYIYILISLVVALIRYIVFLTGIIKNTSEQLSSQKIDEDDSILKMMKHAQNNQRWHEIIKIGSSLSDVLWFTSRKELRVKIGLIVEVAANQVGDMKTLSTTLIEDIGNTKFGLGDVDNGIKYIKRGIDIAERNNLFFILTRGYRNLACCFAYKGDETNCEHSLNKASSFVPMITPEEKKLEALASIEYARNKYFGMKKDYASAINSLDSTIRYYQQLQTQYPENEERIRDRLVKVYREKGIIYIADRKFDDAKRELQIGLKKSQETFNYENIVRCCTLLADLMINNNELVTADGMIQIASQYIDKIDTKSVKNQLNEVSLKYRIKKQALESN